MKVVREADLPVRTLVGRTAVVLFGDGSGSEVLTHSVAYFDVGHAPGHTHASDEVFFVDSGAGEVLLDGVPCAVGPGTLVHTPGDVEHSVHALPGRPMRLVAFASPHMVPGSYPDLPLRSSDRPRRRVVGRASSRHKNPRIPSDRDPELSIETERIEWPSDGSTAVKPSIWRPTGPGTVDRSARATARSARMAPDRRLRRERDPPDGGDQRVQSPPRQTCTTSSRAERPVRSLQRRPS